MVEINNVKICPKCASLKVKSDLGNFLSSINAINTTYTCLDCKFKSTLFPSVDLKKIKEVQRKIKNAYSKPKQTSSRKLTRKKSSSRKTKR
ncbi:hypothetical protein J4455_01395 [Candidatus Woesearchaeota archaeon]|nr:hypothetical protein [Candidatus Woesearchaeota archaeon]